MATMFDYMDWRGDLSFTQAPLNEVDNLIFSEMSYVDFSGIVGDLQSEETITLRKAAARYFKEHSMEKVDKDSILGRASMVLLKMSKTKRFGNVKLLYYVDHIDQEMEEQFSAITIGLPNHHYFIAYRGTDDTLIGWKEDFNMSYMHTIPSQIAAKGYAQWVMDAKEEAHFYIGGHSKGGNLAIYGAMNCSISEQNRIIRVFNNDGPGFKKEVIEGEDYRKIIGRVRTIVPETSIVGMLLFHEEEFTIVRSNRAGATQHDATSWEVLGTSFIHLENVSTMSKRLDYAIHMWSKDISDEKKKQAIDAFFEVLQAQSQTTTAIKKEPLKNMIAMAKSMQQLDPEIRKNLIKTINALAKTSNILLKNPIEYDGEQ